MASIVATPKAQWAHVTLEDLKELARAAGPCVSILAPLDRTRPGPLRMRAVVGEAMHAIRERLLAGEWEETRIDTFLRPLEIVIDSVDVPGAPVAGIAIFHSPGLTRWFPAPAPREITHFVGARFVMDSICRALRDTPEFLLLLLARKNVRALHIHDGGIRRVEFPLTGATGRAGPDEVLNTNASGPRGMRVQFGAGGTRDREYRALRNFYQKVDGELCTMLHGERTPVVLAGTPPEVAMFRQLTQYPHVVPAAMNTSGDGGEPDPVLAAKGIQAMTGWLTAAETRINAAVERASAGRVLHDEAAIVRAAAHGHVRALFYREPAGGPDDAGNVALVETLKHGGSVWPLRKPVAEPMLALLRYRNA